MSRASHFRFEDMLASIGKIERYSAALDLEAFLADDLVQDAVVRNLEVIGEAARAVPEAERERYPSLPWSEMVAMRNIIVHEYFGIDGAIIWETVQRDLPPLARQLKAILDH